MDYFKPCIIDVTGQKLKISKLENLGYTQSYNNNHQH